MLTILNLVANCVYFHVKWRNARHFDARTVDSFVLKRDWGSPCWPRMTRMVSKISQMFILSISNSEWHCPFKSAPTGKWNYVNPCPIFLGIPNQSTAYVKRQARPRWTYVRRSSVTPTCLTPNVRGPSYLGLTRSISWLLMPWLLTSPGHQKPWYWLYRICMSFSYLRKDFKYLCHINVEKWHKM